MGALRKVIVAAVVAAGFMGLGGGDAQAYWDRGYGPPRGYYGPPRGYYGGRGRGHGHYGRRW